MNIFDRHELSIGKGPTLPGPTFAHDFLLGVGLLIQNAQLVIAVSGVMGGSEPGAGGGGG